MPTITALTAQKRNPQRINVFLDGEFAFGLSRIVAAWLTVGQELSEDRIAQLKGEDAHEVAYQQALRLINYRPRSASEVRQNLKKHGTSEDMINAVIERLQQNGLLDDARFARDWVDNRTDFRPRSRRALQYELRQRGVDPEVIDQAVEEVDDQALADQAAEKQARKYQQLEWQDFRQKMLGFLARRGFPYQVSAEAAARAWRLLQSENQESRKHYPGNHPDDHRSDYSNDEEVTP